MRTSADGIKYVFLLSAWLQVVQANARSAIALVPDDFSREKFSYVLFVYNDVD